MRYPINADNPLHYTGTNAAEFIKEVGALGYVLEEDFPGQARQAFSIREVNTTGPIYRIEEGDAVWPGATGWGLTHDKTASTNRKIREKRVAAEPSSEDRLSAIQRILRRSSSAGRHERAQAIADLNAVGVADDEITEALRRAWLTYGETS